jgi:predicted transcriptional regulator
MEVLWKSGEATVQQTLDALPGSRSPAYTTILSVLQKLEKAGWVKHRKEGRSYVYAPRRSREQEGASSLRSFIDGVFGGDPLLIFERLIFDERLEEDDFARLQAMIESRRKEGTDDA